MARIRLVTQGARLTPQNLSNPRVRLGTLCSEKAKHFRWLHSALTVQTGLLGLTALASQSWGAAEGAIASQCVLNHAELRRHSTTCA
jgi:hypothetical protein